MNRAIVIPLILALMPSAVGAQTRNAPSLKLTWENDYLVFKGDGTDRYYTNGVRVEYFYRREKRNFVQRLLLHEDRIGLRVALQARIGPRQQRRIIDLGQVHALLQLVELAVVQPPAVGQVLHRAGLGLLQRQRVDVAERVGHVQAGAKP